MQEKRERIQENKAKGKFKKRNTKKVTGHQKKKLMETKKRGRETKGGDPLLVGKLQPRPRARSRGGPFAPNSRNSSRQIKGQISSVYWEQQKGDTGKHQRREGEETSRDRAKLPGGGVKAEEKSRTRQMEGPNRGKKSNSFEARKTTERKRVTTCLGLDRG